MSTELWKLMKAAEAAGPFRPAIVAPRMELSNTVLAKIRKALESGAAAGTTGPMTFSTNVTITGALAAGRLIPRPIVSGGSDAFIQLDASLGDKFTFTAVSAVTGMTILNGLVGEKLQLFLHQSGGPNSVVWPSTVRWPETTGPSLAGTARMDVLVFEKVGSDVWVAAQAGWYSVV